jgi:Uma2 family endonuclease
MAEPALPQRLPSVEEYLRMEEESSYRHEYVGGMIYALAGGTKRHNRITLNIATRLVTAARGGPCRVYTSDVKLRAADDIFYYPDVMVACGPEGKDPLVEEEPCLAVEIVSPSTETIDRREKALNYRRIPGLKAYLVVDQERRYVERHWRGEDGEWRQGGLSGEGAAPIPCPETKLSLDEIYEGL